MEGDEGRQSLDSLADKMDAAHLGNSRSESGEHRKPDTRESPGNEERPALLNLPGELQNLIITKLHPSAAIALSQTNRHFHLCAKLHRLPSSVVFDYLQKKERFSPDNSRACFTCLRLKSRLSFGEKQIRSPRGPLGKDARKRYCLDCGSETGKYSPGSIVKYGGGVQMYCGGCETLQKRFCQECCWCDSCIRKNGWAKRKVEAGEVLVQNICAWCGSHIWVG